MQQKDYSQSALRLSVAGMLPISLGIWIFVEGASFIRPANEHSAASEVAPLAPVQLFTNTGNDQHATVDSQSGAAAVLSKLTTREWVFTVRARQTEGFRLIFSRDGSFTRKVISDYSETRSGVWAYQEIKPSIGLLFMRTTANSSAEANSHSEEVFRLSLTNDSLLLGRYSLKPDARIRPSTDQVRRIPVKDVINDKNFPTYFRLIGRRWIRLERKDIAFMPDALTLKGDGTFRASYRKEECSHDGYWSLERGQIFLELPGHHCDTRGHQDPVVRGHYYSFKDGSLIFDRIYQYSASE